MQDAAVVKTIDICCLVDNFFPKAGTYHILRPIRVWLLTPSVFWFSFPVVYFFSCLGFKRLVDLFD
ncbi:hypothetical protein ASF92_19635 [Pedobacter sp. Leaf176]|nr:hypothetical protein ASF92_19635 [Pedobacter sp. Leaf176]